MYMCISAYGRDVFEHEKMAAECLGEGGVCVREREREREGERQGEREEEHEQTNAEFFGETGVCVR